MISNFSAKLSPFLRSGKFWVILMMLIGANQVIVSKLMNSTYVYEGPMYKNNFHPYIQTINMFIGEMLSLPIYFLLRRRSPEKYKQKQRLALAKGKQLNMNKMWLFVPAFFDLLTSTMQYVAFNFISTSAYQILKGGMIATTFLFSVTFLKQPIKKKQLIGSLLALIGVLVVGIANVVFTNQSSYEGSAFLEIIGYVLMIGSLFTSGFFFVFQQKLLNVYHVEPLEIVGYQGVFGFSIYLILIPILCYVPCSFGPNACVYSRQGFTYIEGFSVYIDQLRDNPHLIALAIISIFGILIFNVSGVTVTKYINALARAIANMTKSILVWIIGIIITLTLGRTHPNLQWEKLQTSIILLQIVGFTLMALGNFIYTGIIKLPGAKAKDVKTTTTEDLISEKSDIISAQEKLLKEKTQENI